LEIGGEGEEEGVVTIDWTIDEGGRWMKKRRKTDRQSDQGTMDDLATERVMRVMKREVDGSTRWADC
jgi:hypothetical protein